MRTLTDDVVHHADHSPTGVGFHRQLDGQWRDVTWSEFRDEVSAMAGSLVAAGLQVGERVGLLLETRYEWTVLDYAIWWAGGVVVPIYPSWPAEQIERVLAECSTVACVVAIDEHGAIVEHLRSELPGLRHVWRLDELQAMAANAVPTEALEQRRRAVTTSSLATIVYTPGTTGQPKACPLTHDNLVHQTSVLTEALADLFGHDEAVTVLFSPLAHIDSRIVQLCCVRARAGLAYCPDLRSLAASVVAIRPTFLFVTPRTLEWTYGVVRSRAHRNGRARLFTAAAETAIQYSRALDTGRRGRLLRSRHAVFERLVYARLRAAAGGCIRHLISLSAPLDDRLAHFWRGVGLPVLEGYGLTEASGPLALSLPAKPRPGAAGRPLRGADVRIAEDGELLARGPQLFGGYEGAALAGAPDAEGWFRTGDLAETDEDGQLHVTGRLKELLVTAGGKSVIPSVLEDRVRAHPLVNQCLVVGDGRPFVAALVIVEPDAIRAWASEHNKFARTAQLLDDPQLRETVQSAIDDANTLVSRAESIRAFRLLQSAWTEGQSHLTPTQTLRRSAVLHDLRDEVRSLYS